MTLYNERKNPAAEISAKINVSRIIGDALLAREKKQDRMASDPNIIEGQIADSADSKDNPRKQLSASN